MPSNRLYLSAVISTTGAWSEIAAIPKIDKWPREIGGVRFHV
jgi:hypothetical protein